MPIGRDIRMIRNNTILDRGPGSPTGREIGGSKPPGRRDAAYCQITLAVVVTIHLTAVDYVFSVLLYNAAGCFLVYRVHCVVDDRKPTQVFD